MHESNKQRECWSDAAGSVIYLDGLCSMISWFDASQCATWEKRYGESLSPCNAKRLDKETSMRMQRTRVGKREAGFTLIELMIVVAVIGILGAIAVPNFITYQNKSRVSAGMGTGEGIRSALASFAADSPDNLFPTSTSIATHAQLTTLINRNGGTLKATAAAMGIALISYSLMDSDSDGTPDTYAMQVSVMGVPTTMGGYFLRITPGGITKCPDTVGGTC